LTLLLHLDIRLAIGASIISVIATSSGAAAAYVRDRLANLRVAMFLELGTTTGREDQTEEDEEESRMNDSGQIRAGDRGYSAVAMMRGVAARMTKRKWAGSHVT